MPTTTRLLTQEAVEFLELVVAGRVPEAFDRYAATTFRHHNPHFAGDAKSLAKGMVENHDENPHKVMEIKHTLEDGDLVAVHSRVRLRPDGEDFAIVHVFRFAGDRIVELWDVAQPAPADSPNEHGMF